MLQQQINYWTMREGMRHNRVLEGISQQDADTNRMNANINKINANTNIFNAQTNRMNAVSNRIQAGAAVTQAGASVRMAGAAERQAGVAERNVAVTESLRDSVAFNNYMSPFGSAMGKGVDVVGSRVGSPIVATKSKSKMPKIGSDGYYKIGTTGGAALLGTGATASIIGAGVIGGTWALKEVYDYQKNSDGPAQRPIRK